MDEIISTDLHGRLGTFILPQEKVTTPILVPVVDPKNNSITPEEISSKFGFNLVITSAYLFLKRYSMPDGSKTIHEFLDFTGNIMMDSGAYQILAYGDVDIGPIQSLQLQSSLKPDLGVILDVPTPPSDSYDISQRKVEETIGRIEISLDHIQSHPETIWTLPIQGGKNVDLITHYIQQVKEKDYLRHFGLHALGSVVPLMNNYEYTTLFSMIYEARKSLPHNIPLHIFGAGHPMMFPFIVALGADMFDSAAYILFAKDNRYMTSMGTNMLADMTEFPCNCEVCTTWSPKELLHAADNERIRNLALHNLHVSAAEIRLIRESIREGRLWELLEKRSLSHPSLYKAFKYMQKGIDTEFLELVTPSSKTGGLKVYNINSFYRPEFTKIRKQLIKNYQPKSNKLRILLVSGADSPIKILMLNSKLSKFIHETLSESDIAFFIPFIGLVPVELGETYPFSQFVFSTILTEELILAAVEISTDFITTMGYKEITIQNEDQTYITEEIESTIVRCIKEKNPDKLIEVK